MNVLHLTTHLNLGGITVYIKRLIEPLRSLGVETFVLSSGGECAPQFEEKKARVFELPIKTKSELHPKIYQALPKLIQTIQENKIDVLHAHTRITQVMAHWASRKTGIPVVTTCHGFYKRRLGRRFLPAWGDRVVAISEGVEDHLIRDFKVHPRQIRMIHNAVDVNEIDFQYKQHDPLKTRGDYGFGQDDFVMVVIARLVQDKGHEYLIRALRVLEKKLPHAKVLIVGSGPYRNSLEKLVQKLKLEESVHFTGNVMDITKPLAAADLFVLPATWREGFGLSIVEAMTCHKPVVVTNIWALNTLIRNEETGLLVPPSQEDALADAILKMAKEADFRLRISQAGRQMVEEMFSIDRMAREIRAVYRELVG